MANKDQYLQASEELSSGQIDRGLWAMALSEARGDEKHAGAVYVRLRAEEISRVHLALRLSGAKDTAARVAHNATAIGVSASKTGISVLKKIVLFAFFLLVMAFASGLVKDLMRPRSVPQSQSVGQTPQGYRCVEGTKYNPATQFCEPSSEN